MSEARAILQREFQAGEGETPASLPEAIERSPIVELARDAFLLKLPSGLAFHYRRGLGVSYSRPDHVDDAEVDLFLNGSVYGAIAWINGLVPLHASAVMHGGRVFAFTGPSGAGKSTLAAALGTRGFTLYADDVLVLDLSAPGSIACLPGHKRLKLWSGGLALTGLAPGPRVQPGLDKYFVTSQSGHELSPLAPAALFHIEEGADTGAVVRRIEGAECFRLATAALYRPQFGGVLLESREVFALLGRLANELPMHRFIRPRCEGTFDAGVDVIAAIIRQG